MIDHKKLLKSAGIDNLTADLKKFLNETRSRLKGCERRKFMAKVVMLMGRGGQIRAERELGWDRKTIIKGTKELASGIDCMDNFCGRGRHRVNKNCRIFLTISSKLSNRCANAIQPFVRQSFTHRSQQRRFTGVCSKRRITLMTSCQQCEQLAKNSIKWACV
jgi:hypothetical protein